MSLTTVTAPAAEPISEAELRQRSRIPDEETSAAVLQYIRAARRTAENYLRRRLITQTVRLVMDRFASQIIIPTDPVQSVDEITYVDGAGETQTLDAADYHLVVSGVPCMIVPAFGTTWPVTRAFYDSVSVDLIVGYGDAATDVPDDIVQGIFLLAGHFYENREAVVVGTTAGALPLGVEDLLGPHRFWI